MGDRDVAAVVATAEGASDSEQFDLLHELREHDQLDNAGGQVAFGAARLLAASGDPSDLPSVARLSLQAHRDGIEGAGLIHAEASDKIALYTGRPQLYGTVMLEHQGDIVQPPVDKRISDQERAELGVPPMGELQRRMATLSRRLAVDRAATTRMATRRSTFLSGLDQSRTSRTALPDGHRGHHRLGRRRHAITFVAESASPVTVTPAFPIETWDAGDGLQVLSLRVERLDEAVITYTFTPTDGMPSTNFRRGSHDGRFRGVNAPPELASNDPLLGTSVEHAVDSDALGERRKVTVYRPLGHAAGDNTPVIYATDGTMFAPYARRLDAAIEAGICPPVVIVAAHSASFDPIRGNLRAAEYLPGFDEQVYTAHQQFFMDELPAWAEAELGVPSAPARRGIWGCSDGGGHAAMAARLFPERFGHAFVYSTGMPPDMTYEWTDEHPFMHLCAGTLEGPFHQATEAWAGYLMLVDAPYHFTERVAGHDLVQWAEELPHAINRAWG